MSKLILLAALSLTGCTPVPLLTPAVQAGIDPRCFPELDDSHQKLDLCPATRAWLDQVWISQH